MNFRALVTERDDADRYAAHVQEIRLEDLPEAAKKILAGQVHGRLLVRPN